jgi:hypothetical protein
MSDDKDFLRGLMALHDMACGPEVEVDERDAKIARLQAVADAAFKHRAIHRGRGPQHFTHHIAGCYLCRRLRTLDDEVKSAPRVNWHDVTPPWESIDGEVKP